MRSAARLKFADSAKAVKNLSWRSEIAWVRVVGRGSVAVDEGGTMGFQQNRIAPSDGAISAIYDEIITKNFPF